jgi:hypothetical protein
MTDRYLRGIDCKHPPDASAAVRRRTILTGSVLIAAIVFSFTAGCPFLLVTGIPCPGCGMTRAILSALRFDFTAAFGYHPLFPLVILCAAVLIVRIGYYCITKSKTRLPASHGLSFSYADANEIFAGLVRPLAGKIVIGLIIGAFVLVYMLRITAALTRYLVL